uniref:alpha-ketoglutarate-dependent dioxygenase AlkB family protein n=1 Tax=Thaumasiovibrio occultus TaxID=1891184 RepID=UPI000B353857|nr:alpha-ketoglutarate-dependent dioxygenase AlkB [Thaumasiovibrio occultus]
MSNYCCENSILYIKGWLDEDSATSLMTGLCQGMPWRQEAITMFGRSVMQPRLQCWMGDKSYTYSGLALKPLKWHYLLVPIRNRLMQEFGVDFNAVLLNYYRDGHDYMGYHRDNEKSLGEQPVIASLSLGVERRFLFRHRQSKEVVEYRLAPGSLLVMRGDSQTEWEHALPKMRRVTEPRINLTFRHIVDEE